MHFFQARGLGIRLATPSPADAEAARGIKYRSRHKGFRTAEKTKMAAISGESIFGSDKESSSQARRKAVMVKAAKRGIKTRGMRLMSADENATARAVQPTGRSEASNSRHSSASSSREETVKRRRHEFEGRGEPPSGSGSNQFQVGTVEAELGSSALAVGDTEGGVPKASRKRRRKKVAVSTEGGLAAISSLY